MVVGAVQDDFVLSCQALWRRACERANMRGLRPHAATLARLRYLASGRAIRITLTDAG